MRLVVSGNARPVPEAGGGVVGGAFVDDVVGAVGASCEPGALDELAD
jgi:hypothetical protein